MKTKHCSLPTALVIALMAMLTLPAIASTAGQTATPEQEIRYLLTTVGTSGCTFTRNGTQHSAEEAAAHLTMKYERAGSRIKTAESFIDRLASESSWTGKPYLIQCGDATVPSRQWLTEQLQSYRAAGRTPVNLATTD